MENDNEELKRIFDDEYIEKMETNENAQQFIEQLDNRFNKYLDEREEELRTPFEVMIAKYRSSLEQFKKQIHDKLKINQFKSIEQIKQSIKDLIETDNSQQKQEIVKKQVDLCSGFKDVQRIWDEVMKQFQQVDEQTVDQVQKLFKALETKQEYIKQLKQCQNEIQISNSNKVEEYRNTIKQFQQEDKNYRIYINLGNNTNLQFKQQVVEMIDQLNVNHKVGKIQFYVNDTNICDNELLVKMISKYSNVYDIYVYHYQNQLRSDIYDQIKSMLEQLPLLGFTLYFYGSRDLNSSTQGFELLKQYNEIIKTKLNLESLCYNHSKISKNTSNKQEIEQIINQVTSM